jgi:ADP-glucose pyrophosphorylase
MCCFSEGCCIENAEIRHSVVGVRSQIHSGVRIVDTILMGADYYERPAISMGQSPPPHWYWQELPDIEGAIIDKNACLGEGVVIKPFPRGTEIETDNWVVQDGCCDPEECRACSRYGHCAGITKGCHRLDGCQPQPSFMKKPPGYCA